MIVLFGSGLFSMPFTTVFGLLYHILMSIALIILGGQRRLSLRWLALLPVGQEYMLGAVADDIGGRGGRFFQGETYFRHILACIRILSLFSTGLRMYAAWKGIPLVNPFAGNPAWSAIEMVLDVVPFAIQMVQAAVLYKIFSYYRPRRATPYALLCLFLRYLTPIFLLMICKTNRDQFHS